MTYRSSYELDLEIGFALLEQMEDTEGIHSYRHTPDEGHFDDILLTGLYGGQVDPDEPQEYLIYSLDWPEQLADRSDQAVLDELSEELDSLFPGWVLDRGEDKVYILRHTPL